MRVVLPMFMAIFVGVAATLALRMPVDNGKFIMSKGETIESGIFRLRLLDLRVGKDGFREAFFELAMNGTVVDRFTLSSGEGVLRDVALYRNCWGNVCIRLTCMFDKGNSVIVAVRVERER